MVGNHKDRFSHDAAQFVSVYMVKVAVKKQQHRFTICSLCIMSICLFFSYFPF